MIPTDTLIIIGVVLAVILIMLLVVLFRETARIDKLFNAVNEYLPDDEE